MTALKKSLLIVAALGFTAALIGRDVSPPWSTEETTAGAGGGLVAPAHAQGNLPPVADAGRDQTVKLDPVTGTVEVTLNGGASTDPKGMVDDFAWTFFAKPAGSGAALDDAAAVKPTFTADVTGDYVLELVLTQGNRTSAPDRVTISTDNSAPVADAGADQAFVPGDTVTLDASGSSDFDGDALSYSWALVSVPTGSVAPLLNPTAVHPSFTPDTPGTYVAEVVVSHAWDATVSSEPDLVVISSEGVAPVAEAGPDVSSFVGNRNKEQFDGSLSNDADGDQLAYDWKLISVPLLSAQELASQADVRPTLVVDKDGLYLLQLTITDASGEISRDTLTISTVNSPPVANAGPDRVVLAGDLVELDAGGTTDVDGDLLSFRWALVSKPPTSTAALDDPTSLRPSFEADVVGTYVAQLIVKDDAEFSAPDTVVITTGNVRPVAEAGPAQTVATGQLVQLDATGSSDANSTDTLTFSWTVLEQPNGNKATISDPASPSPSFTFTKFGEHVLQVVVSDGALTAVDTVPLSTINSRPVAVPVAEPEQPVVPGDFVQLKGNPPLDVDGDPLAFAWAIIAKPEGSTAVLDDLASPTPSFTTDLPGFYLVQLIVREASVANPLATPKASIPRTVVVAAPNTPPVADAGPDQSVFVGQTVTLDGSVSSDPDGNPLTFAWRFVSAPSGSTATLAGADTASPTFVADVKGGFLVELVVNDGFEDSSPDLVTVTVVNRLPVADAGPDQTVTEGDTVQLAGGGSSDPDGDSLSFAWSLASVPAGSGTTLSNPAIVNPTFVADVAGAYVAQLIVNDGEADSAPDTVTITAEPSVVVNLPPVLDPVGSQTINLGSTLSLTLSASDPNGDTLSFMATPLPLPDGASLNGATGAFTFTPNAGQVGDIALTFIVSDGVLTDSESVVITVLGAPVGGVTALTGRLLDTNDFVNGVETPVVGATVSLLNTGFSAVSDTTGAFVLSGVPSDTQVLDIDTATANLAPDGSTYAGFREAIDIIGGVTNAVERPFFLPRIATVSLTTVNPEVETIVNNPDLGVTLKVAPFSAFNPDGSDFIGQLSISEVPLALAPAALPDFLEPGLLITIQPVGVTFDPPAAITFPNIDALTPGSITQTWSLDPERGEFMVVGIGQVSADGSVTETIAGGIVAADWHTPMPPGTGGEQSDADNQDKDKCCDQATGSSTALGSGGLTVSHDLISYRSFGQTRTPQLTYDSLTADPQPTIVSDTVLIPLAARAPTYSTRLKIGGVDQGKELFTSSAGLPGGGITRTIRQALQFDAGQLASGVYPYELRKTSNYQLSRLSTVLGGRVLINNQQGSPFGAGWNLAGLSRITPRGTQAVLVRGNGSISRFSGISLNRQPESNSFPYQLAENSGESAFVSPAADFNDDGVKDFVVAFARQGDTPDTGESFVQLFLGDGNGGYPVSRVLKTSDSAFCGEGCQPVTSEVIPGDFDGDGITDLLVANSQSSEIQIYSGLTAGFFDSPRTILVNAPVFTPVLKLGDFDGDGNDDIVLFNRLQTNTTIVLLLGDGAGNFPVQRDVSSATTERVFDLFPADLNGDGALDLVIGGFVSQGARVRYAVALNDGFGNFSPATGPFSGVVQDSITKPVDIDSDGNLDLVALGTASPAALEYYWGDGAGNFARDLPDRPNRAIIQDASLPGTLSNFILQDATDIDDDGDADFVISYRPNFGLSTVLLFFNDGRGDLPDRLDVPTGVGFIDELQFDDLSGDGLKNLFVRGNRKTNTILVNSLAAALGTAAGTFARPQGDFSVLVRNEGGSFNRRMKDGTTHSFNSGGLQTSMVDRNNNTTTYGYDAAGRLISIADPAGLVTTFAYSGDRIASIIDPAGRVTRFEHDSAGNLIKITDPDGSVRQFAYDERHRMISQTSKRGFVTTYEYNFAGRNIGVARPDGSTRRIAPSRLVGVIHAVGDFGSEANPASFLRPADAVARFTDGNGNTRRFTLDRFGAATRVTDGLGRITGIARNDDGDPVQFTSPGGFVSATKRDSVGNVLERRSAIGLPEERVVGFEYEPVFSQVTRIVDPNGNPMRFFHDAGGNLTDIVDTAGVRTEAAYADVNCPGQVTLIRVAMSTLDEVERTFAYDPVTCRQAVTTDFFGNSLSMSYDAAGNVTALTDASGRITRFEYDAMNRLVMLANPRNTDPAPACGTLGVTCINYNDAGNVAAVTDGNGNITALVYDNNDRVVEWIDPLGQSETYAYDGDDNLARVIDRKGQRIVLEYDAANRLVRQIMDEGTPREAVRTFAYDDNDNDNVTSVADADSALSMVYDSLDRLIGVSTAGSPAQPLVDLAYTYDGNGNRLALTDPTGVTDYTNEPRNLMSSVLPPELGTAIGLAYDAVGRRSGLTRPNGLATTHAYDAGGRLTLLEHSDGVTALARFAYDYTPVDIRERVSQARTDLLLEGVLDYGYDPLDQLVSATHPVAAVPAEAFAYDAVGNLLRWPGQAVDAVIGSGNRLLQDDVFCYAYDANGNLESRTARDLSGACTGPVTTYTYDVENRLTRIDFPGATFAAYRYDGLGRRIEKDMNGVVTHYVYDREDILLEYDGLGVLQARWTHGPDTDDPLMMARDVDGDGLFGAAERFYYHADGLGSIVALTDDAALTVRSYAYTAFGSIADEFGSMENPYTFTGREHDPESGLYYYRARYYGPVIGRFLQEDPIGFVGGINAYAYVDGDPVNLTDSTGECPWCVAVVAGAVAGGAIDLGLQLLQNGGSLECVDWGSVGTAALSGAALSGLGPTGFLLGRGGARAAQYGYSRSAGLLNRGNTRFGWSGPKNGRDVLSGRVGNRHYDIPGTGVPSGANPLRDGAAAGAVGGGANRAGTGSCGC